MDESWLSSFDIFCISLGIGAAAYFLLFKKENKNSDTNEFQNISLISPLQKNEGFSSGLVQRMNKSNKTVAIFYGSQTGTAEEFASRLAKDAQRYGLKALVLDPEELDVEELPKLCEIENSLAIFCVATYGEGDPTDNAQQLYDYLKDSEDSLKGLSYAVFGLGNKTYEHFNAVGAFFDKKLNELGAERVFRLGVGDDDTNIEEDFVTWKDEFWPAVVSRFNIEVGTTEGNFRSYDYKVLEDHDGEVFDGEMGRLHSYEKQKGPYDAKNPYLAPVKVIRELHKGGGRSCLHMEFDISGSRIGYNAGDHVAVYPTNDLEVVEQLGKRLKINLDTVFEMNNLDEDSSKRHPFPCPTTFRAAFSYYLDITNPLRTNIFHELIAYCSDDEDKEFLSLLSSNTDEGKKKYQQWACDDRRTLAQVLEDLPSCYPEIGHLMELLPRLQCRYYSIASSPRKHPDSIHVCASVIRYEASNKRINHGVATKYLSEKEPGGSKVPIFVRRSQFHLPFRVSNPVLMIGPGTGIAPFIGFLQDREVHKKNGRQVGDIVLYFGCRKKAEDYIYQEQLEAWKETNLLSELNVAFSRDTDKKVYVQHLLSENKSTVWDIINNNGHIYVCGDAKYMARDVQDTIVKVVEDCGGKTNAQAQDYVKKMMSKGRYSCDVWS